MPGIGVFIPCYNVEKTIRAVFNSFSPAILARVDEIVAVDNLSRDNTLPTLQELQAAPDLGAKLTIITNSANYGLGGSQKIAYQYFLGRGFSHFMVIHGDDQGNAGEVAGLFLDALDKDPGLDLVLASRFHTEADTSGYSGLRRAGNSFFNFLTWLLTGHRMSDAGTGIMLVRTGLLKQIPFSALTNSFQFNPQLNILMFNLKNLKTREVPLNWRDSPAGSNIRSAQYCWTLLRILVLYRINKSVLGKQGGQLFNGGGQEFRPEFGIERRQRNS